MTLTRPCLALLALLHVAFATVAVQAQAPSERQRAFERAAAEQAAGRRAEAARILRDAADKLGSVHALVQLARIHSGDGNAAGAIEALRKARTLAPNSEEVLSALAQVSLAARTSMDAIDALEPLARIAPTVGQHHYLLGVAFIQAGDLIDAVDALQQAQRVEPDRELTLLALGLALNGRKLYAEALPHLQRSLERQPDNLEVLAALAETQEGLGHPQEAEALARRVLTRSAMHPTANFVLGLLLMKQERYADARDALLKAAEGETTLLRAHYQLSLAYARLGDEASSRKHLELYQQKQREIEERVSKLRGATG